MSLEMFLNDDSTLIGYASTIGNDSTIENNVQGDASTIPYETDVTQFWEQNDDMLSCASTVDKNIVFEMEDFGPTRLM